MIGASPLRFQLGMAVLAIGGAVVVTEGQGRPESEAVFAFQDPAIDESSGLVDLGEQVATVNDSGDGPVVYVVDKDTGETVGRTTYTTDEVLDVEAMALGHDDSLWVGDIGDNAGSRMSVVLYKMPVPGPGDAIVDAQRFELAYRDGPRDAEALMIHPGTGRVYVASKGIFAGKLYAAPPVLSTERTNVLRPVGDVPGIITDGAFFPGGDFVALRSYGSLTVLSADRWRNVGGMTLPDQRQGEAIAVPDTGPSVLLSSEGAGTDVLTQPLAPEILAAVAPPRPSPQEDEAAPRQEIDGQGELVEPSDGDSRAWWYAGAVAVVLAGGLLARALARRR